MLKKQNYADILLNLIPVSLAFLMPIFFLPTTLEFFEFNKLTLITVSTIVLLVLWAVKMLLNKKVSVAKSPLDLPILLLVAGYILSTVFSLNKTASLFGSQGRWFPSLFAILTLVLFYYSVASNVNETKIMQAILYAFVGGTTLSTLVALLSYFGIPLGTAPYLRIVNFSLTGSTTTVAILAALATVISLTLLVNTKLRFGKELMLQAIIINFFAIALFSVMAGWAVLVAGLLAFAFFEAPEKVKANNKHMVVILGVAAAIFVVLIVPTTREIIVNKGFPKEFSLSARDSWLISSSTLRDFPVLGTGPSTFYLNFTRYRPLSQNNTNTWNVRFDKPGNEVFNIMGTMGIVGMVLAIFLAIKVARTALGSKNPNDDTGISSATGIALISLLVAFVFTYSTVLTMFLFFMFLALSTAKTAIDPSKAQSEHIVLSLSSISSMTLISEGVEKRSETLQYIAALLIFAASLGGGYFTYKNYKGEYLMRRAIVAAQANDGTLTYQLQGQAINTNPRRDSYHNTYAHTNLALANSLATRPNLTDADKTTIQTLIAQSIRSSRVITEVIDPLNVANWETRAAIYRALVGVAQNADQWAITSYNTAIQLDPTNPRLRLDLGGVYYAQGDFLSAANMFRQATTLKSDYANAHYNFAASLKQLNALADAQRELEITMRLVPKNSPDYQRVVAELEALKSIPAVAGAQSDKPTVEEIEEVLPPEEKAEEPAPQEPLSPPGAPEEAEPGVELNIDDTGIIEGEGDEPEAPPEGETPETPEEEEGEQPTE